MPPAIARRELIRKFRVMGYHGPFSGGRHQFMVLGEKKIRIPNPHGSDEVGAALVSEILRQAGITADRWRDA